MPSVTIRVPEEVLGRLKAAAAAKKMTVTDLLLEPWRGGEEDLADVLPPSSPRSGTTVRAPQRRGVVTVKAAGRFVGFDPVTGERVYK